jgi:hypothetical protein
MSYEKMGDLSFEKSNYIAAQKYYDSCGTVMPENYPNGEDIKIARERELFYRWMEFAAFTAVYRTHEGNVPSDHIQSYTDKGRECSLID